MGKEINEKDNPNTNVYNLEILDREVTIETTFHPDRNPEQTTFSVSGDLKGTRLEGGMEGVTVTNDKKELLQELRESIEDRMTNPPQPRVITG